MEAEREKAEAGAARSEMQGEVAGEAAVETVRVGASESDQGWVYCLWAAEEEPGVGWRLHGYFGPSL